MLQTLADLAFPLLLLILGLAATVPAWFPNQTDERERLPIDWKDPRPIYTGLYPQQFEAGYIAGAWIVTDRTADRIIKLVWQRFEADIEHGSPQERAYALGWTTAVRPTWEAAMGFDLPEVRARLISGAKSPYD